MSEEAAQSAGKEQAPPVQERKKDGSIIIVIATDVSDLYISDVRARTDVPRLHSFRSSLKDSQPVSTTILLIWRHH